MEGEKNSCMFLENLEIGKNRLKVTPLLLETQVADSPSLFNFAHFLSCNMVNHAFSVGKLCC